MIAGIQLAPPPGSIDIGPTNTPRTARSLTMDESTRSFLYTDRIRWSVNEEGAELVFRGAGSFRIELGGLRLDELSDGELCQILRAARSRERFWDAPAKGR